MAAGGNLRSKPPSSRNDALEVVRRLRDAGHVAYLAGGCVRDLLMGLDPKDFDVATDAPPPRVRKLFSNTQAVGVNFGVILVRLGGSQIEVATFRTEGRYLDGRRPEAVAFSNAEHDARRRDFTINGLFMDPFTEQVIDYVGGQDDIRIRKLRAIGNPDERFNEDHLRLLRAVRFAARFGLDIDAETAEAMRRHAPKLVRISPERIADELRLMLSPFTRTAAWPMLWRFALLDQIFRFLPIAVEDTEFDPARSIFLALSPEEEIPFGVAMAAGSLDYVLHSQRHSSDFRRALDPAIVQQIGHALRQSLRISNDEEAQITGTLGALWPLVQDQPPRVAVMKRFLAKPVARGAWEVISAVEKVVGTSGRVAWLGERLDELSDGDVAPEPLITGDDLTAAGMKPGPVFRHVLESVYDAQLEGEIVSKEEAMEMAGQIGGKLP